MKKSFRLKINISLWSHVMNQTFSRLGNKLLLHLSHGLQTKSIEPFTLSLPHLYLKSLHQLYTKKLSYLFQLRLKHQRFPKFFLIMNMP